MSQTIENKVRNRLYGKKRGWVFTPKDFSDLGGESAINTCLHRLEEKEFIVRLSHGLYEYPRIHEQLGVLPPDIEMIAKAISKKFGVGLQPSGAYAANLLGLSEQVPGKIVFLTDGESKKLKVGNLEINFKKTTPKIMKMTGKISGLVVQALKYIGKDNITPEMISKIQRKLDEKDKKRLLLDSTLAPAWITKVIKEKVLS